MGDPVTDLDKARATNRELHRRLQAVEGPMLRRAEKAEAAAAFWLHRRKFHGERAAAERRRAIAAEAAHAGLLSLVIRLHREGVLSEGQVATATGLGRVEVRRLADAMAEGETCR